MRTETRRMQYLYESGDEAVMMDMSDYDQVQLPKAVAGEALDWILPNDEVDVLFVDGRPGDLQVPSAIEMEVKETEPGVRGDTASGGGNKPATLESGGPFNVPLFVNIGDRVRVDTRTASTSRGREPHGSMRRTDQRRGAIFALLPARGDRRAPRGPDRARPVPGPAGAEQEAPIRPGR